MKRTVLIFGVISGVISSVLMLSVTFFAHRGIVTFDNAEVIGYTSMFLAFLLVFFGIRSYREQNGGAISFGRAFTVGILIMLISCVFYVTSWEFIYFNFMPDFGEKYAAHVMARMREKGASDAALAKKMKEMNQMTAMLHNPVANAAMTFLEPLPVGLIMTLVSAGILRRRRPPSESLSVRADAVE